MLNRFSCAPAPMTHSGTNPKRKCHSARLLSHSPAFFWVTLFARPPSRRQCPALRPCALGGSPNLTPFSLPFATVSRSWTPRRVRWHC